MSAALLRAAGLRTALEASGGEIVHALDGVDLEIGRGETFAIVGESGCGKSMTALTLMRLLPEQGRIVGGSAHLDDTDLLALPEARMRDVRGRRIAMIFQEPATSLNPVLTVGWQIGEVLERHMGLRGEAARARATGLLDAVGIADSARCLDEYPFQLSGGMKQRVMIALALAAEPELLVADEPTTALDVTIQAQVLDLLARLQRSRGMSILLITHDLGIVAGMAQRVAVMYAGQIVETAPRDAFFGTPQHPYARKLFASLPGTGARGASLEVIPGQVPLLSGEFRGCRFADRCEQAFERCRTEPPGWTRVAEAHLVRCHLREREIAPALAARPAREALAAAATAAHLLL
ncbi:MAG TPA: ABC transporter ATP-binding protein, partial [Burkholderiales bacterium]|nr:ABC transporter ATP-binding protein [Burkholderiales bacterium]